MTHASASIVEYSNDRGIALDEANGRMQRAKAGGRVSTFVIKKAQHGYGYPKDFYEVALAVAVSGSGEKSGAQEHACDFE